MFDGRFRSSVDKGVGPIGSALGRTGLSPDHLTALGLVLAVPAAVAIGAGRLALGLVLLIASAVPDLLDGALAKASGTASRRGAFFDSVADRVTDALVMSGLAWYLEGRHGHVAMLPFGILAVSTLISYERAKAESLGFTAKGGLMERAERIILLCIGLVAPVILVPILWAMLILTSVTALQRFAKVWRQATGSIVDGRADARSAAPSATARAPRVSARGATPVDPLAMAERWRVWRLQTAASRRAAAGNVHRGSTRRATRLEERRAARSRTDAEEIVSGGSAGSGSSGSGFGPGSTSGPGPGSASGSGPGSASGTGSGPVSGSASGPGSGSGSASGSGPGSGSGSASGSGPGSGSGSASGSASGSGPGSGSGSSVSSVPRRRHSARRS